MNCKKLLAGCAVLLVSAALAVVINCDGADVTKPGENDGLDGYSLELSKMYDSIRVADSINQVRVKDSIRIVDSLALARVTDSVRFVDSLAFLRMRDSIRLFRGVADSLNRIAEETKRIKDSTDLAELAAATSQAERDTIERRIRDEAVADSIAEVAEGKIRRDDRKKDLHVNVFEVLGAGYNVRDGQFASATNIKGRIIDLDKLLSAKDKFVITSYNNSRVDKRTITGSTGTDYQKCISSNLNVSVNGKIAGVASFGGQVTKSFDSDKISRAEWSFATRQATVSSFGCVINATNPAAELTGYLSDRFIRDAANMNVDEFIAAYGTHVILGAVFGGRLDYNMSIRKSSEASTEHLTQALNANIELKGWESTIGAGTSSNTDDKYKSSFDETSAHTTLIASGGNLGLAVAVEEGNAGAWNAWVSSVKDNPVWCDFYPGSYILPIDELVSDYAKKAQIRNRLMTYFDEGGFRLTEQIWTHGEIFNGRREVGPVNNKLNSSKYDWKVEIDNIELQNQKPDGTYNVLRAVVTITVWDANDKSNFEKITHNFEYNIPSNKKIIGLASGYSTPTAKNGSIVTKANPDYWHSLFSTSNGKDILIYGELKIPNKGQKLGYSFGLWFDVLERVPVAGGSSQYKTSALRLSANQ